MWSALVADLAATVACERSKPSHRQREGQDRGGLLILVRAHAAGKRRKAATPAVSSTEEQAVRGQPPFLPPAILTVSGASALAAVVWFRARAKPSAGALAIHSGLRVRCAQQLLAAESRPERAGPGRAARRVKGGGSARASSAAEVAVAVLARQSRLGEWRPSTLAHWSFHKRAPDVAP